MAQLTQFILDGTFDAQTGAIKIYETGRGLYSSYTPYNIAVREAAHRDYYLDELWDDLAWEQGDVASMRVHQQQGDDPFHHPLRYRDLEKFDIKSRLSRWRYLKQNSALILKYALPEIDEMEEMARTGQAEITYLDPFPLINATFMDKVAFFALMDQIGAAHLLPQQTIIKANDPEALQNLLQQKQWQDVKHVVLKSPDQSDAQGVRVIPADLIRQSPPAEQTRRMQKFSQQNKSYTAGQSRHPLLVVQQAVNGRKIHGYQPTFRVVLSMQHHHWQTRWTIHKAYWKFPDKKATHTPAAGTLISRPDQAAQIFDEREMQELQAALETHIAPAFEKLAMTTPQDMITTMMLREQPAMQIQAALLYAQNTVLGSDAYFQNDDLWQNAARIIANHPDILNKMDERLRDRMQYRSFLIALRHKGCPALKA